MFDKIKSMFSSKEPNTNPTLATMKKGYMVTYFLKDWEVKKHYDYDWGNNFFSTEYLLDSGDDKMFLSVSEEDDGLECSISKEVAINSIDPNLRGNIVEFDKALSELTYKGEKYFLTETSQGESTEHGKEEWSEFVMYDYKNSAEDKFISITRWSETELEAFEGSYVKEFEFENILPC